jgi:hypothetical protein
MKTAEQIDLWLKNEPGKLSEVSGLLGANGVNILAFYVATEGGEGKLHFIADDPDRAMKILKTAGYRAESKEVIACEMPAHPGGLNAVLKPLKLANINLDYIYPCIGTGHETVLILGLERVNDAIKILEDNWIRILGDELYPLYMASEP